MRNQIVNCELGEYQGTAIRYRDSDNYVNATEMCKACDKLWGDYWRQPSHQEFLSELSAKMGIPIKGTRGLVESKKGNHHQGGGTWVHRKVAIHLASWLSSEFAVWAVDRLDQLLETGRVVIHREHQEAQLEHISREIAAGIRIGLSEGLEPIRSDVRRVEGKVDELGIRVASIEKRRDLSSLTKREHLLTVAHYYQGRCPCCSEQRVLDSDGDKLPTANWEHWHAPSKNRPHETWLTCRGCNINLRDDFEFKRRHEADFVSYQRKREDGTQPLFKNARSDR